jgi:hypothetical protein
MASVLVMGSSHVNGLRHYINNNPALHNFDFGNDPSVTLFGIGGRRNEHLIDSCKVIDLVCLF